jgi:hypothetical protein
MDTSNPQSNVPRERPTSMPTVTIQELEQQCHDLRTLLAATLVSLLILTLGLTLFLVKQNRLVRSKLKDSRPVVYRTAADFQTKEPNMKTFIYSLQNYAASNPDFQPILDRYRMAIPQYFVTTMPVSSTPTGLKVPTNATQGAARPPIASPQVK